MQQTLDSCIDRLDLLRDYFSTNPGRDFSRNRKIPFSKVIHFMIELQSKSLPNEIMDYFGHTCDSPSVSALIQQRSKILPEAWFYLFYLFTKQCNKISNPLYKGYRVFACDGSDINIFRDPADKETYISEGESGYNAIHLNALYNIMTGTYQDITIQGKKKLHERAALCIMVDRYRDDVPSIVISDRGYESFNVFAHFLKKRNTHFLIRLKDNNTNGILAAYELPEGEFDLSLSTILTKRHTKETLEHPEKYTILAASTDFDFITAENPFYPISFRIVRFDVSNGNYVAVATNLSSEDFTLTDLKALYKLRWSEETSFRELKYTIGLVNFHSKKRAFIEQEVYSRMILYNFCQMVTGHVAESLDETESSDGKYRYKINFATAVNICRAYLKSGGDEIQSLQLIKNHINYIKCDVKYPLHLRPKRNKDFIYRTA